MNNNSLQWGPHYWNTFHSICLAYPQYPNSITKKKYYDFIHNIPLFLPDHDFGDHFSHLLEKYPLKPYLDNRDKLCKWMHFIHNIINKKLNKPQFSYHEYIIKYKTPRPTYTIQKSHHYNKLIIIILITILIGWCFKK